MISPRLIQIGCLDHALSTALYLHQRITNPSKAHSTGPSLRCWHITLPGHQEMLMETSCWNGPATPSSSLIGSATLR